MEPAMRVVLLISVVCFTVLFSMLLLLRRSQLGVADLWRIWSAVIYHCFPPSFTRLFLRATAA